MSTEPFDLDAFEARIERQGMVTPDDAEQLIAELRSQGNAYGVLFETHQREMTRLHALLDRERAHIPGKYAFLHRHYAMSYVRRRDPDLHAWAASEAGQQLDREGGKTYVDYVAQLEADNAALQEALHLAVEEIGTDMHYVSTDVERQILDTLAAPHPGASLLALLAAARAYRDAWQGTSLPMGPLAIGEHWDRHRAAIEALDDTTAPPASSAA